MNTEQDPSYNEPAKDRAARIQRIVESLSRLSVDQVDLVIQLVEQFRVPFDQIWRDPESDIVDECVLRNLGDALRFHHGVSHEPLSKDRFEYALDRSVRMCGRISELAPKGNPGHDITIAGQRFSLKTEAAANINLSKVHISKFMELGKGEWDLELLRQRFFEHMKRYDRIFVLRCYSKPPKAWAYELVEIPKALLEEASGGQFRTVESSRQLPKPGYCDVVDVLGAIRFQLYFDAGTERKLQVKAIRKDLCRIHAIWSFPALRST